MAADILTFQGQVGDLEAGLRLRMLEDARSSLFSSCRPSDWV